MTSEPGRKRRRQKLVVIGLWSVLALLIVVQGVRWLTAPARVDLIPVNEVAALRSLGDDEFALGIGVWDASPILDPRGGGTLAETRRRFGFEPGRPVLRDGESWDRLLAEYFPDRRPGSERDQSRLRTTDPRGGAVEILARSVQFRDRSNTWWIGMALGVDPDTSSAAPTTLAVEFFPVPSGTRDRDIQVRITVGTRPVDRLDRWLGTSPYVAGIEVLRTAEFDSEP